MTIYPIGVSSSDVRRLCLLREIGAELGCRRTLVSLFASMVDQEADRIRGECADRGLDWSAVVNRSADRLI